MTRKRAKRVNPHRRQIASGSIDPHELIAEASKGNLYYAWLLLLPTLLGQEGCSSDRVVKLWQAVNEHAAAPDFTGERLNRELNEIQSLLNIHPTYNDVPILSIRSEGDLAAVKRKLKANALHSALCIIAIGLRSAGGFSDDALRRLILNADLTLAEVQNGYTTYEELAETVADYGLVLDDGGSDMALGGADSATGNG